MYYSQNWWRKTIVETLRVGAAHSHLCIRDFDETDTEAGVWCWQRSGTHQKISSCQQLFKLILKSLYIEVFPSLHCKRRQWPFSGYYTKDSLSFVRLCDVWMYI